MKSDRSIGSGIVGGLGILLLGVWGAWLFGAQITVYRTSARARLEVTPAPAHVAARVSGRVVDVHLTVGARVKAGDALVVLDTVADNIALERVKARLAAIEPELASVARELDAEVQVRRGGAAADQAAEGEVIARRRAAEVALRLAETEEARTRSMVEAGVQPSADLARAEAETKQRRADLDALGQQAGARNGERVQRDASREARREQLERQRAELDAGIATLRGEIQERMNEIERHTMHAPVDGVLGEVATLRPGAVLAEGTIVATVVPDGTLQVVAEYEPTAIGRIATGQRARVRLDGFPWTHYGTLRARVVRMGSELREGTIRVELSLEPGGASIPVAHGMTGVVEIEVERASPVQLLLRSIGEDNKR